MLVKSKFTNLASEHLNAISLNVPRTFSFFLHTMRMLKTIPELIIICHAELIIFQNIIAILGKGLGKALVATTLKVRRARVLKI